MLRSTDNSPSSRGLRLVIASLIAVAMALGGISTAAAGDDVKIGYVDLHKALEQSEEGQKIKAELEQEFNQRQQQLDQKQQEVMQKREQMEQQAMMLSEQKRQEMAMQLQRDMQELQETYLTLQNELAQQEAQATHQLFERMRSVIEEIGKEKGFTMVIERTETSVLYAVDGLDLTSELIERFDAKE